MKCEICGKENLENEDICVKCGNPLLKDKEIKEKKKEKVNKLFRI